MYALLIALAGTWSPVSATFTASRAEHDAELYDNPTAQDLAEVLPLTLTISDLNPVEEVAELSRALTMDGVPAGADPEIDDIGYYAPTRGLVFYYGDVAYSSGIVRIGRLPLEAPGRSSGKRTGPT